VAQGDYASAFQALGQPPVFFPGTGGVGPSAGGGPLLPASLPPPALMDFSPLKMAAAATAATALPRSGSELAAITAAASASSSVPPGAGADEHKPDGNTDDVATKAGNSQPSENDDLQLLTGDNMAERSCAGCSKAKVCTCDT
jgi:hypothetical protein